MDPFEKLKESRKTDKVFSLKPVNQKQLLKHMSKMKKKHSAGTDGLSQDKLVMGAKALVYPLLQIINQSIREGMFPSQWKEALVTPVLKKGDPTISNFRCTSRGDLIPSNLCSLCLRSGTMAKKFSCRHICR